MEWNVQRKLPSWHAGNDGGIVEARRSQISVNLQLFQRGHDHFHFSGTHANANTSAGPNPSSTDKAAKSFVVHKQSSATPTHCTPTAGPHASNDIQFNEILDNLHQLRKELDELAVGNFKDNMHLTKRCQL